MARHRVVKGQHDREASRGQIHPIVQLELNNNILELVAREVRRQRDGIGAVRGEGSEAVVEPSRKAKLLVRREEEGLREVRPLLPRSPLLLAVVRRLEPPRLLRSSLDCPSFSPCRLLMIRVAPLLLGLSETSEPNFLHSA